MSVQPPPPPGGYPTPEGGSMSPAYKQGPAPGIGYSSALGRLIAYLIDGFVLGIIFGIPYVIGLLLVTMGAGGNNSAATLAGGVIVLVSIVIAVAYKPWMWSRGGQTVGYKVMRLKVVRVHDGGPLSGAQAVGRLLGYIVSSVFSLGFIWIAFDARRQGWHDKLAGTVVVEI